MTDGFTVKEMVEKILEKQEKMDDKIDSIHSQVKVTNGTVGLHTKLIWGSFAFTFGLFMAYILI